MGFGPFGFQPFAFGPFAFGPFAFGRVAFRHFALGSEQTKACGSEETLGLYSCVYSLGSDQPKYVAPEIWNQNSGPEKVEIYLNF